MSQKYNVLLKLSFALLFFIIVTLPVSAASNCVDSKWIEEAASFNNTASCLYKKYFFTKDSLGDYRIYMIQSNNKIVRYIRNCGFGWASKCYSPVFIGSNNSYYYCTDANTPATDFSDKDQIKSVAVVGSDYPSISFSNQYTANRESFAQTDYSKWLGQNSNQFCPPNVVASYIDAYITGTLSGTKAAFTNMSTSSADAAKVYNEDLEFYKSEYAISSTLSNNLSDYLTPRQYLDEKSATLLMDVLPLVQVNGVKDSVVFSSYEVRTEDSEMSSLYNTLKQYESTVTSDTSLDCTKLTSREAVENDQNASKLDTKMLPSFVAAKVKVMNAELRGFGSSFPASTYNGYSTLSNYLAKNLKTPTGEMASFSPTALICNIKNLAETTTYQDKTKTCLEQLKSNPNDTQLKSQCDGYQAKLAALGKATSNYNMSFEQVSKSQPIDCQSFGATIMGVFKIIMIIAPILVIIFGSVDFAKASLASDESAIKKAGTNFAKRIIAAVILFLLPMIVNIILSIGVQAGIFSEQPENCITESNNK